MRSRTRRSSSRASSQPFSSRALERRRAAVQASSKCFSQRLSSCWRRSFLFHTYATRWASFADVIPIGVFMIANLAYALRRFMGHPWIAVLLALQPSFVAQGRSGIQCAHMGLLPSPTQPLAAVSMSPSPMRPALLALLVSALVLAAMRHRAAPYLALQP